MCGSASAPQHVKKKKKKRSDGEKKGRVFSITTASFGAVLFSPSNVINRERRTRQSAVAAVVLPGARR